MNDNNECNFVRDLVVVRVNTELMLTILTPPKNDSSGVVFCNLKPHSVTLLGWIELVAPVRICCQWTSRFHCWFRDIRPGLCMATVPG